MWFTGKKTRISESGVLIGGTDYHSHILPGVDDGVRTCGEALKILDTYADAGIAELWLTPHIMEDFPNTTAGLRERYDELCSRYTGNIKLHLSAEYMIDNRFTDIIEEGDLLPVGTEGNHLLVETSYFTPPMHLYDTLKKIMKKGFYPLLAHPERYMYMESRDYRKLRETGVRMQLNLPSLAGAYGSSVQKKAEWLLANDFYTVAGSDTHNAGTATVIGNAALGKRECDKLHRLLAAHL